MNAAILWALVRRFFYLLFCGMWRGERAYTFYRGWRVEEVRAFSGNFASGNYRFAKTFYPTDPAPSETKPGDPGHFGPHDGGTRLLGNETNAAEGKTGKVVSENLSLINAQETNELASNGKGEKGNVPPPSASLPDPS